MSDTQPNGSQSSSILPLTCVVDACEQFETEWRDGHCPRIEAYLESAPSDQRDRLLKELLAIEVELRIEHGENPTPNQFRSRYPTWGHMITLAFAQGRSAAASRPGLGQPSYPGQPHDRAPSTQQMAGAPIGSADVSVGQVRPPRAEPAEPPPTHFGRYEVTKVLGSGGFGTVYLARDGELTRPVAIKVPRAGLLHSPAQVESFLAEARNAASLCHPSIVGVHDVGRFGDFGVFVVFEYVEGRTLAELLDAEQLSPTQIASLLIPVADAAHHAHRAGLVHRDLKPSNVLLDSTGRPHITDFGLAIREELQDLRVGEIAGTPHYMAPEQVRGETHRLDGRTDIWAIGVMLYRCLLGRQPFSGRDYNEIFEEILNRDPKPPRQINDKIPRELERICLKCLSRPMADRYETAADLADDLRRWLVAEASTDAFSKTPHLSQLKSREAGITRVVPKGLHAFDIEDAEFFLTLVPGPRDRDAVPEAIRAWKRRIEERDRERTFSVGVLYGPSGSGKSSLVRAGVLPRLSRQVRPIYVEAAPGATEARIRAGVHREFPDLAGVADLDLLAAALRDRGTRHKHSKVLLVLDQFEQWLQSHRPDADSELVRALRHCDGLGLQALLLVRDDFWMATTRFLRALEIRLVEGVNSAPVELFDRQHAACVLAELGRALGRIKDGPIAPGSEQARFIDRAVKELASPDGRIIPVRLVLFAEMLHHRDWTIKTLRELGGIQGIGEMFLEESFSARSAPLAHRVHERAAQSILQSLLPEPSSDIRIGSKPVSLLRDLSGYADRPSDFDEIIYILDNELRMVTPVDLSSSGAPSGDLAPEGETRYQLTHDYLVPSLRLWLTRRQRQTRRGRAEIKLAAITALWSDRPDSRRLPSLLEWLEILCFTRRPAWTTQERLLMKQATRHFAIRAAVLLVVVGGLAYLIATARSRERAHHTLETARRADFAQLPALLSDLSSQIAYLRPTLAQLEKGGASVQDKEVATIALYREAPTPERALALLGWLKAATPDEAKVLLDALAQQPESAPFENLRRFLLDESSEPSARLRVACALARQGAGSSGPMTAVAAPLAEALLREHPRTVAKWIELLGPAQELLISPLSAICRDSSRDPGAQAAAAEAGAEVLERRDEPAILAALTADSTPQASHVLLRELVRMGPLPASISALQKVLDERPDNSDDENARDALAGRQAASAIALAALGQPGPLWPLLRHRSDLRVRTVLIERLAESPLTMRLLMERLAEPDIDPIERQAILLAWAEMQPAARPAPLKSAVMARARVLYLEDPDPGVHSAAELLLRRFGESGIIERLQAELQSAASNNPGLRWVLGPNEHTFVVLPGPLEFWMGAPPEQGDFYGSPALHFRKIDRSIMVATKEITLEQFQRFQPAHSNEHRYGDFLDCAATRISWYQAAGYCNWLSEQAKIPRSQWCYPENPGPGMTISEDSVKRTGFRLPTEAEWEYFCRAGTSTSRFFGESTMFLSRYAWTWSNSENQLHPPGERLPNTLGLFDVFGNAWEWCQNGPPGHYDRESTDFPPYPSGTKENPAADPVLTETVDSIDRANETWRILRGGAFSYAPDRARSAYRDWQPSGDTREYLGLRVVRTLPPRNQ